MSILNLRNCNIPCRYFKIVPINFKVFQCRPSNFTLGKGLAALSNLRVRGPTIVDQLTYDPLSDNRGKN